MHVILKELRFRWKKLGIIENYLSDIREQRIIYFQAVEKYRDEGRPIIYMDKTYHSSHASGKVWSDDSSQGIHSTISKGDPIIIIHAGGEKGFIHGALTCLLYTSRCV